MSNKYNWTDNPTVSGVSICDTDILNDCLMHLKYDKQDGNGFPLFTPMVFDHILTGDDAVGWALQGSVITNTYPEAVSKIQELYNEGVETEYRGISCKRSVDGRYIADIEQTEKIDRLFVETGIADFYIFDSTNQQFYLPKTKWFNQFTLNTDLVNQYNEPGLPNITGTANNGASKGEFNLFSGALKAHGEAKPNISGNSPADFYGIELDASISSPVYGKSETVQPPSSNKLLYYKVGNTITNEAEIDVSNLMNDVQYIQNLLETKIGKTECPAYITDTYVNDTSGYTIYSNGLCEQWGKSDLCTPAVKVTIALMLNYKDTNYNITISDLGSYTPSPEANDAISDVTSTNFKISSGSAGSHNKFWRTIGYVDLGE